MCDKEGRWLPFSKDGSTHDCKRKNGKQEVTLEAVQKTGIPRHNCKHRDVRLNNNVRLGRNKK